MLDALLRGRLVDRAYDEVDLADARLHPEYLLHENCTYGYNATSSITHICEVHTHAYIGISIILFPRNPVEPVTRTHLPLKYSTILAASSRLSTTVIVRRPAGSPPISRSFLEAGTLLNETERKIEAPHFTTLHWLVAS